MVLEVKVSTLNEVAIDHLKGCISKIIDVVFKAAIDQTTTFVIMVGIDCPDSLVAYVHIIKHTKPNPNDYKLGNEPLVVIAVILLDHFLIVEN